MASYKKTDFFETEEGTEARRVLTAMVTDDNFNTVGSYSANLVRYPSSQMSFVEKHMDYLRAHPATDPGHYLSNLRLMTRIK